KAVRRESDCLRSNLHRRHSVFLPVNRMARPKPAKPQIGRCSSAGFVLLFHLRVFVSFGGGHEHSGLGVFYRRSHGGTGRMVCLSQSKGAPHILRALGMKTNYDMVVIGGGAAGLTAAGMAAVLGAKTLLVSAGPLGGDCTWHGCVPSKSLLKAAKVAHEIRNATAFGLISANLVHDWSRVIGRVHSIRNRIYEDADAPPNMQRLGVEVLAGRARFINQNSVEVSSSATVEKVIFSSRYFVIATGSRPRVPKFAGSDRVRMLTNESLFEL